MGKSKETAAYPLFARFEDESKLVDSESEYPESLCIPDPPSFQQGYLNRFPQMGYDSTQEDQKYMQQNPIPEVNLENVLKGVFAIITGRNKSSSQNGPQSRNKSNLSFLESSRNGESFLHSSVYAPSAPSLPEAEALQFCSYKEVLLAEPPEWLPDSHASGCMQCGSHFKALARGRHHCRFCGGIFCWACSKGRCLMPVKFRQREPQRVCDSCYDRLEPLQDILIKSMSNAMQMAKHDVTDWTCSRGWLNLPIGLTMEHEIYKATNTLRSYRQVSRLDPEKTIPVAVLGGARGLAILTVAKFGAFMTYKVGTGLVISRRSDGSWSAPSAILSAGLGWGPQIGGELTDYILVLHGSKAVKAFTSQLHFSLGAGLSAAAGPVGRVLEADLRAGDRGSGICYTYSCSKGAFLGASLEGNVVMTRQETNARFYGDAYLATRDILLGTVERPRAAEPLYTALEELFNSL
ncbi:RING/FYVE/PHD-type zinc finger family protein [Wolffia australiana]